MPRRRAVKSLPVDSSDDDEPLSIHIDKKPKKSNSDDSSSESDIENYLQPVNKIDLDSPFFNLQKESDNPPSFDKIENDILAGVTRLSDSDSEENEEGDTNKKEVAAPASQPSTSKLNFSQLHEYTRKIEEAKRQVEAYNKRKQEENKEMNIDNLLALGESKEKSEENFDDFESGSDSEGWEEVEESQKAEKEAVVPQEGLQITVEMPGAIKKKKGVDFIAAIKRRINRVRKENQVLVHKVHLLCWLAHGNFLSQTINSQNVLAVALSLLPSEKCYPPNRTDLNYLEQILKWYRNTVIHEETTFSEKEPLEKLLQTQITKKTAFTKKMLVYIFVAILRSLGIQCRIILSFEVEPLRPPNSQLLSLSTKEENVNKKSVENGKNEDKSRSKSTSDVATENTAKRTKESKDKEDDKKRKGEGKSRSKSTSDVKTKEVTKSRVTKKEITKEEAPKVRSRSVSQKKEEIAKPSKEEQAKTRAKSTSSVKEKPKTVAENGKSSSSVKIKLQPRSKSSTPSGDKNKETKSNSSKDSPKKNTKTKVEREKAPRSLRSRQKLLTVPQVDGANDTKDTPKPNLKKLKEKEPPCPIKTHPKRLKKIVKYKDSDSEDDFSPTHVRSPFTNKSNDSPKPTGANLKKLKAMDVRSDIIDLVKKSIKQQKDIDKTKKVKKRKSAQDSEEDSDYLPEAPKKKPQDSDDEFAPKIKVKQRVQVKKNGEEEEKVKKRGMDVWAEVFLETEEKWISVDVVKGKVHCVSELYNRATHPVSYIVAWNNDNTLKDITRRYCPNFNTATRKLRIDKRWWDEALKGFIGPRNARDKEEDDELERQHLEKPLPTTITEYKNHPLYVLKRHLLKYEALYPPDLAPLGYVRNEAVYPRDCVYTLHTRDIWMKHAKVVKLGEKPYKIVKARPRWDKLSNKIVTGELCDVFGLWQTEDYDPPTAENGVVPRNAFGNVELFKPCMLPKKTVHLKLPGLNKICRRMNIDCAPALTGFDFNGGWTHPVFDGFVVCEEFADELVAAWEVEQDELDRKEQEKIDKRVYGHWRRLIRGLLIRERIKVKYDLGDPTSKKNTKGSEKKTQTKKRKVESESHSESD